jgi:hypothetical protein
MSSDFILQRNNFGIYNACTQSQWKKAIQLLEKTTTRFTKDFQPVKNFDQWSALHWAAASASPAYDACEQLLKSGFTPTLASRDGETPLDLAHLRGHENIIELLEFHSEVRVSMRQSSIEKKVRRLASKQAKVVIPKVNHVIPCEVPDMQPEEGFQTFDELLVKFKVIDPNFKFPRSRYMP